MKPQFMKDQNENPVASIVGKWEGYKKTAAGYTAVRNLEFKENGTWIKTIKILENSSFSSSCGTWSISGNVLTKANLNSKIEEEFTVSNSYLTTTMSNGVKRTWLRQ